jgi:hypothetical protein
MKLEKDEIQHIVKTILNCKASQWIAISKDELVLNGNFNKVKMKYDKMEGTKILAIKRAPGEFQDMESKGKAIDLINLLESTAEIVFF